MQTKSILEVAQKLIRAITDNMKNGIVKKEDIINECRELQKWINEGKLEERNNR